MTQPRIPSLTTRVGCCGSHLHLKGGFVAGRSLPFALGEASGGPSGSSMCPCSWGRRAGADSSLEKPKQRCPRVRGTTGLRTSGSPSLHPPHVQPRRGQKQIAEPGKEDVQTQEKEDEAFGMEATSPAAGRGLLRELSGV